MGKEADASDLPPDAKIIAAPSVKSLFLVPRQAEREVAVATGFVATRAGTHYLVTNRHVVRGRDDQPQNRPDNLVIVHNIEGRRILNVTKVERLYDDDGAALWYEHPIFGPEVDVAALPLTQLCGVHVYTYDPWAPESEIAAGRIGEPLSIIGFPFGITGGQSLGFGAADSSRLSQISTGGISRGSSSTVGRGKVSLARRLLRTRLPAGRCR